MSAQREVVDMSDLYTNNMRRRNTDCILSASSLSNIDSIMTPYSHVMLYVDMEINGVSLKVTETLKDVDSLFISLSFLFEMIDCIL